ncbi:MAG: tetratricopeptide repeat protein [Nitrospinota bacterium]
MFKHKISILIVSLLIITIGGSYAHGALTQGGEAPAFTLMDLKSNPVSLEGLHGRNMIVLYFFTVDSRPCREGLIQLKEISGRHGKEGIEVIGISRDDPVKLREFYESNKLGFVVLNDSKDVSELYNARAILPTTYIISPRGRITDILQGGGASTQHLLNSIAEREFARKKDMTIALNIYKRAIKNNPEDIKARSGIGYSYIKEGRLDRAEEEFMKIAGADAKSRAIGKAGLAETYYKRGDYKKALTLLSEAESLDPNYAYTHVIRGNIYISQGDEKRAKSEFEIATKKSSQFFWQRAIAYNNAGRLYSMEGRYEQAEKMYDEAGAIDPYHIEALSNRGVISEKKGDYSNAIVYYENALSIDPRDELSRLLLKRAKEYLNYSRDHEQHKRIDKLVSDLIKRYKKKEKRGILKWFKKKEDTWTSRPMIISMIGFESLGGPPGREGMVEIFQKQLSDSIQDSGRVQVVERKILDKLLEELRLSSSELADPSTALKVGKILSARLITTGSLIRFEDDLQINLRMVDTETSAIKISLTLKDKDRRGIIRGLANTLSTDILQKLKKEFPLKGKIVDVKEDRVIINLGSRHGLTAKTRMNIIHKGKPIKVSGKVIGYQKEMIGTIEITDVEKNISYAIIIEKRRPLEEDQKVIEVIL